MGSAEPEPVTMRAFFIVALAVAVHGDAKPYTVGQVLTGATNGGVITSTTYHGGLKVAGFPHAAVVPALGYAAPVVYGKREAEAEPYTVGQVLAGQTAGGIITSTTYAGGLKVAVCPLPTTLLFTARGKQSPSSFSTTTLVLLPRPTQSTLWPPPLSVSPTPPTSAFAQTSLELLFPARQKSVLLLCEIC